MRINIVGCGKAATVLATLFHRIGAASIGGILNRSLESANRASSLIGAGMAVETMDQLPPADITLVATPDKEIGPAAAAISQCGFDRKEHCFLHLSGAIGSAVFRDHGIVHAECVSVHPVFSFGIFDACLDNFAGCWCGIEGDNSAGNTAATLFQAIGANTFDIDSRHKLAYHAAGIMVTNYANALVASAMETYALAGIDRSKSIEIIQPVLEATLFNVFSKGPGPALTGPVSRGDDHTVKLEVDALQEHDPDLADVYQVMGRATLRLAAQQGLLDADAMIKMGKALE